MCGRFVQERSIAELAELFEAEPIADLPPARYNLAPSQPAAVVVERPDGRRGVTAFEWEFIPAWSAGAGETRRPINARAEGLASSRLFREAFRRRRCLVPADAFFEWAHAPGRRPHAIRRRDRRPLAFAGLWESWRDPGTGIVRRTFAIVTTAANELVEPLHDRMPVALPPEAWSDWLDPDAAHPGLLGLLVRVQPADQLEAFPVRRLVNDVRNDGPGLLEPDDPDPEPLSLDVFRE